jgi:hypothetical protein
VKFHARLSDLAPLTGTRLMIASFPDAFGGGAGHGFDCPYTRTFGHARLLKVLRVLN